LAEVILGPSNVRDHSLQGSDGKSISKMVIGNDNSPFILVPIDVVAATRAGQAKPIRVQCANKFPRSDATPDFRHS